MTVAELCAKLEKLPANATVHAYEGEANYVVIRDADGSYLAEFKVDPS